MSTIKFISLFIISLFLVAGPAGAQTVVFDDPADPTKATGINDLEVGGTSYNVIFEVSTFANQVYGAFPGTFNIFNTVSQAEVAVDYVNSALNSWGATSIGNINTPGIEFFTYNTGYYTFLVESIEMIHTWRAAKLDVGDPWVSTGQNQWTYNLDERNWAVFTLATAVENYGVADIPKAYKLFRNYPNPFNPTTTITYQLPKASQIRLTVYNLLGQEVRTLVNTKQAAGSYSIEWNSRDNNNELVPTGVYVYKIEAGDFVQSRKMVLVK